MASESCKCRCIPLRRALCFSSALTALWEAALCDGGIQRRSDRYCTGAAVEPVMHRARPCCCDFPAVI